MTMSYLLLIVVIAVIYLVFFKKNLQKKITEKLQAPFPEKNEGVPYYIFIDVETTGLLPGYLDFNNDIDNVPKIVQIAWMVFDIDGNYIKSENFIIKQNKEVPDSAFKIHGISMARSIEEGVDFKGVAVMLVADLRTIEIISAHNARFDLIIIQAELMRKNLDYSLKSKVANCTMLSTTNYCKIKKTTGHRGYKWPRLDELVQKVFLGDVEGELELVGAHNAFNDVWVTAKCYFELLNKGFEFKNNNRKVWEGVKLPRYLESLNTDIDLDLEKTEINKRRIKIGNNKSKTNNRLKRMAVYILIIITVYIIVKSSTPSGVYENHKLKYAKTWLNIREKPSSKHKVLKVINPNDKVITTDSIVNGYILILNNDYTEFGWASLKYLQSQSLSKKEVNENNR